MSMKLEVTVTESATGLDVQALATGNGTALESLMTRYLGGAMSKATEGVFAMSHVAQEIGVRAQELAKANKVKRTKKG
jgi:hypothetical protein